MTKNVKFQSISVKYPSKLLASGIWIRSENLRISFLDNMYEDFDALKINTKAVIDILRKCAKKEYSNIMILDAILVIEASFLKNFPLKKSYWKAKDRLFNNVSREASFIEVINKTKLYNLAVTPVIKTYSTENAFEYTAAFPFIKTQEEQVGK